MGKKRIREVHQPPPADVPPTATVRWVVPRVVGQAYAHAMLVGSSRTLCGGFRVEGGVFPPHSEVPKCDTCMRVLEARGKRIADGA